MSTRANIIVTDGCDELIFYRHSDGYPTGTLPTLNKFIEWVKSGRIRDNVEQAAGWLILIGADEYKHMGDYDKDFEVMPKVDPLEPSTLKHSPGGWKCGSYEPATDIHGDIEFLYVVDLSAKAVYIDGKGSYRYEGKYRAQVEN